jgi:hypothetical protein
MLLPSDAGLDCTPSTPDIEVCTSKLSHRWVNLVLHGRNFNDIKSLLEISWKILSASLHTEGNVFEKSMFAWEKMVHFACTVENLIELAEQLSDRLLGLLDIRYSLPFGDSRLLPPQIMDILSSIAHDTQPYENGPEDPLQFKRLLAIFQQLVPNHPEGVWLSALDLYWAGDSWNARRIIRSMTDPAHYGAVVLQRRLLLEYAETSPAHHIGPRVYSTNHTVEGVEQESENGSKYVEEYIIDQVDALAASFCMESVRSLADESSV